MVISVVVVAATDDVVVVGKTSFKFFLCYFSLLCRFAVLLLLLVLVLVLYVGTDDLNGWCTSKWVFNWLNEKRMSSHDSILYSLSFHSLPPRYVVY